MSLHAWVMVVLALAAMAGVLRQWRAHRADPRARRAWRLVALLLAQPLLAGALYLALFPPPRPVDPATLVLLTRGAEFADAARAEGIVLALPEAKQAGPAARVPDLATALRRHPGTARLQVLGAGLEARDRDAARTMAIDFDPPALPAGFVELALPDRVDRGAAFAVAGRVEGAADGSLVELHDPAGRRVDAAPPDAQGRFLVQGVAMAAGAAPFRLQLVGPDGEALARVEAPLWIQADAPPRVLLLAGAPGPETRALRRWLVDAGAEVQARIALGGGLQLGTAPLDAQALAQADLVIADARSWSGLGEAGRVRVLAAVEAGLGLLLRADTPLPGAALRGLGAEGFAISGGAGRAPWTLPPARVEDEQALRARIGSGSDDAPFDLEQAQAPPPALTRRSWQVRGGDAVAFAHGGESPPGWWRGHGRGRIGLWTLVDTYVLPLHGRDDLFAGLWSGAVATLARPRAAALPAVEPGARVDQRLSVCGWPAGATVEAPDGGVVEPLVDPATGARRCAGIWPRVAGWHRLRLGKAERWFHVATADADQALQLAGLRQATLELAAAPPAAEGNGGIASRRGAPGPAWPWFVLWLLLAGATWSLERSRLGLAAAP